MSVREFFFVFVVQTAILGLCVFSHIIIVTIMKKRKKHSIFDIDMM